MNGDEPQTLAAQRARDLYDEWSPTFLRCAGPTFQAGLLRRDDGTEGSPASSNHTLVARGGLGNGMHLLDIGCGVAGPALDLAQAWPNASIVGVTISPVQVALAQTRISEAGLDARVQVFEADYHVLPFEDGTFDGVYAFEVLGYSADPDPLGRELARVLKPGGRLYFKGIFAHLPPYSDVGQAALDEFDTLWGLSKTRPRERWAKALTTAGFDITMSRRIEADAITNNHYIGAMLEFGPQGMQPNAFGKKFLNPIPDLPTDFGELGAVKR